MMAGRTRRRSLLAIAVAAALLTAADGHTSARAQDAPAIEPAAQDAFDAALRSYERALQSLESDAEQGDVQTQWILAGMYVSGRGAPKDTARAIHWLERAADEGHLEAQYQLGSAYDLGMGLERDRLQALMWFEIAAARGHPGAAAAVSDISEELSPAQRSEAQSKARAWLETGPRPSPQASP